jgi:inner membrane protein
VRQAAAKVNQGDFVNRSLVLKALLVAGLVIVLMLPVAMIRDLVAERQARRNEAVTGIAEGWGKRQTVAGPYLAIPYERQWTEVKQETVDGKVRELRTERSESKVVRLPAESVDWSVDAEIGEKVRGIYKARLYSARLRARGSVEVPVRGRYEDGKSRYKWGAPRLVLGISDPLGIRAASELTVGGAAKSFEPGSGDAAQAGGLHVLLGEKATGAVDFAFSLDLGGSEDFAIAPLGADTAVAMRANWPHPSFQGRFLPAKHEIGAQGFTASWKVSRFAAGCPLPCNRMAEQIVVSLIEPVGLYQQLERASKYGFLFIFLTAAAFMLIELLRRLAIHPVQYLLVGLAIAMFFLLLTALSEHIDFAAAYAIATFACVAVITAYLVRVLRNAALGLAFGAALASLYGMLYALLQAEDHALLGGSILLFALLAAVMLATRRVDWYGLSERAAPSGLRGLANRPAPTVDV